MCKIIFTLCICICFQQLSAQGVGINTDGSIPPVSAMLEVKSSSKGILIPRVALVSTNMATPIPAPANSLLVYNTADAGSGSTAVTPGYYYWNGEWIRLLTTIPPSATDAWYLVGNTGINPSTQFIGTKDNQPLIFKVNNVQAGKLSYSSMHTLFGVEAGKSITAVHSNDAFGSMALYSTTLGGRNTAIGNQSLYSNTGGNDNVGVGIFTLWNNIMGSGNVAIGSNTLTMNINGNQNTAVGKYALMFSDLGDFNTAIGSEALNNITNGDYNTSIGYRSDFTRMTGFNNTALGAQTSIAEGINNSTAIGSRASVACNNCMVFGGLPPYDVNVGIGTNNPSNALEIHANGATGGKVHLLIKEENYNEHAIIKMTQTGNPNAWTIEGNPSDHQFNARFRLMYNGSLIPLSVTGDGNVTISGTLTQSSDSRLKTNISGITTALSTILQLHGYQYQWKEASRDQSLQSGVLAEEVKKVLPHLVKEDDKGFLSVNYSGLLPYLIESVKEQQAEINRLSKENKELLQLKAEVAELRKMMEKRK